MCLSNSVLMVTFVCRTVSIWTMEQVNFPHASVHKDTSVRPISVKYGHIGTLSIIERLSSFRGKMYCHYIHCTRRLVHRKLSFIQRCPLIRVSFIRGSTV